jgi:copper(I)-binding protein
VNAKPAVRLTVILGVLIALSACASADPITVQDAWVRASPAMAQAGAAYMIIENHTAEDDQLLSAAADVAATVELHESAESGGMMTMTPVSAILVPANGQAELAPGGLHIMLIGLTRELVAGEEVTLTLTFEKAGVVTVTAPIRDGS